MTDLIKCVFCCVLGLISIAAMAKISVDDQARLLAGLPPRSSSADVQAITSDSRWHKANSFVADWQQKTSIDMLGNMFSPEGLQVRQKFFSDHLGVISVDTKHLLYLFGGPDVLFPSLLFPNFERIVLVGLENPGDLPDPAVLLARSIVVGKKPVNLLMTTMAQIRLAFRDLFSRSYFITSHMGYQLRQFGVVTPIAVGLVAAGHTLTGIQHFRLGRAPAVRVSFQKPSGQFGDVIYVQQNLSNESLAANPQFEQFLMNNPFETAYYKAASFVPSHSDVSVLDEIVLNKVDHLVQNDDGIPFAYLERQAAKWSVHIFGMYTPPHPMFFVAPQHDLLLAYDEAICAAKDDLADHLLSVVWHKHCQNSQQLISRFHSLTWDGFVPFHYGYSAMSGPQLIPFDQMTHWTNLLVANKVKAP